ncbi:MAG: alpha/beta fold hydrolase [Clostridiales bacterium]|nr:alpha/beta fold hydrolase [Candidatus Blautia equi]
MFAKYEFFLASEADGLNLSVLAMLPAEKPYKGVVQLVHGMCENKERYLPFMNFLAENGYVSVIHDHRGHGQSVKDKADLGYMYGGGAKAIVQDIHTVNQKIHEYFPVLPVTLFGHSMGSLAVRAYTAQHDDQIDKLVVCGSPSENPASGVGEFLAKIEGKLRGMKHKSTLLTGIALGSNNNNFKAEGENAWLCTDPEICKAYNASEYCGFLFTDDGFLGLFGLMKGAYDVTGFKCSNPSMPVLFISGEDDPCRGNNELFGKAVKSMRRAGYQRVKGKLYPGMRHEILNEREKEKVFKDVLIFLENRGIFKD